MSGGLLTTTVGSFPKPDYVVRARNEFSLGRISRQELAEGELKATAEVVRLQDDIGLDILVDGEMYRGDMVAFFAGEPGGKTIDGMKLGGLVRSYGNRYYHKPVITGQLAWAGPLTVEMWRYAQGLTDRPVKGMLTGPYTMVEWSFDEHYASRRDAVLHMAKGIRREGEGAVRGGG